MEYEVILGDGVQTSQERVTKLCAKNKNANTYFLGVSIHTANSAKRFPMHS